MPDRPDFEAMDKQFVLEDEKFKEFVREHNKFTIDRLKEEPTEGLHPELVVMTKDMDLKDEIAVVVIASGFNESEEKHKTLFGVGRKFYEDQKVVRAVVLASECWCSQRPQEGDWPDVQPRHDPLKTEGIIVAGAGMEPRQRMSIVTPVKRDEKNNIVIDGESDEHDEAMFFLIDHFWRGYFSKVMEKEANKKKS